MAIQETYFERQERLAREGRADVYQYDSLPERVKHQIVHIWNDALHDDHYRKVPVFDPIEKVLLRALGLPKLAQGTYSYSRVQFWFIHTGDANKSLSVVELVCQRLSQSALDEINFRLRQNGVGYQFESGQVVRVDNQFVHSEIVKPALALLSGDTIFATAEKEFKEAHVHYRANENRQAVTLAGAAFESTLKAICTAKNWQFEKGARATDLIKIVNARGLFPDYLDRGFEAYIAAMKTGLPGVRNDAGPHGSAPNAPAVADFIAAYAIHLSAANIVLAIQSLKALR